MALLITSGGAVPQFVQPVTLNPANITANSISDETFTVTGLTTDMVLSVQAPSLEAGVALIGAFVSATNTLKLKFWNYTNADINPASQVFQVIAH